MKLHHSFGAAALTLVTTACGLGSSADIGADHKGAQPTDAGATNTGGATQGTGGSTGHVPGAGGATQGTGGAIYGTGGATQGTGGAIHGTGGATQGTGGAIHGTGGATQGSGGHPGGVGCGQNICVPGEFCCNASCGMCAPMGSVCSQIACLPHPVDAGPPHCVDNVACVKGSVWSPTQCQCVPETGGACTTAADCHLVSNYCGGCNCLALAPGEVEPLCVSQVDCLVDPCQLKTAACVGGHCVAQ